MQVVQTSSPMPGKFSARIIDAMDRERATSGTSQNPFIQGLVPVY